jgi:hypothetical protein
MRPSARKQRLSGKKGWHKKRLFFILIFILFLIVVSLGTRYVRSFQDFQNKSAWAVNLRSASQSKGTNYLLYGLVENNGEAGIEEMFFLNYPPDEPSCNIVFIPGKVLMHRLEENEAPYGATSKEEAPESALSESGGAGEEASKGALSKGEAFEEDPILPVYTPSHFYNEGGGELLIKQVSRFLNVPVHHFIEIKYNGIARLVDYKGGISYQGYDLNGQDYLDYFLREDEDEEPLARALRRAETISKFISILGENKGFLGISSLVRETSPYIDTDFSWKELQDNYAIFSPLLDPQSMIFELPGSWRDFDGELFFEPNRSQIASMIGNLGKGFILPRELITVEVLNGSGVSGVAAQVGQLLEDEGFQVVRIDNADNFEYQRSHVISRLEDIEPAKEVAILIPGAEFFKEPLGECPAMVTVIIGQNFSL